MDAGGVVNLVIRPRLCVNRSAANFGCRLFKKPGVDDQPGDPLLASISRAHTNGMSVHEGIPRCLPMNLPHQISVAIVGAGISGVSAALRLQEVGIQAELFDRGRGVGGRCSSRQATPYAFDHGAQYFTVRDRIFGESVKVWRERGWIAPWQGRIVALDGKGSISETGATERWVGTPSMSDLPSALASDLKVRSNCNVEHMEPAGKDWELFDQNGASLGSFERVLLAMPPGQALRLLPPYNPLGRHIQSLAMQPCWALMLGFEGPLQVDFDGAFCSESPLSWISRNNSKPGRPQGEAWVLHANPAWSTEHSGADRDSIRVKLELALRKLTSRSLPAIEHADLHRWGMALPVDKLTHQVWMDRAGGIALAGDAYMGGRIEGAYLSGRLAAEALVGAADRGVGYQRTNPDPEDA
ncbi:MAG: renalase [Planctomycetota bacterium]|jgi:renalase